MRRREFITFVCGAAAAWPLAARAQQPAMPVIGSLVAVSAAEWGGRMAAWRRGLSEAGFVEGRNIAVEYRWADGQFDRLPGLAADLVDRKVAVIFASASVLAVRAAKAATQTIPIVFSVGVDPVAAGLVASLSRPGGNATGFTTFNSELGPKRLELLREVIPNATRIALLVNPKNPVTSRDDIEGGQSAARRLGLEIIVINGGSESEIENAFATAVQQRTAALQVGADAYFASRREQIAALALRHAIPTISSTRDAVAAGQLMGYGSTVIDGYRQAGAYVARVLKGEKPADLAVIQPTKFELAINLKTAKALGLEVPATLLARADEVIE